MAHAEFSPSGAHRWIPCPGSVFLSRGIPDKGSRYADEGSAAHFLASTALTNFKNATDFLNEVIGVMEKGEFWYRPEADLTVPHTAFTVDSGMAENVQVYIDLVLGEPAEQVLVEQKFPIGHITGEDDAKGTADAVIIKGNKLTVIDLKYGMGVQVNAKENYQLGMYAAGAIEELSFAHEFDEIELVVCQPRINHVDRWVTTPDWISELCRQARDSADKARAMTSKSGFYWPGEKQCKFCKAKGTCTALTEKVMATITDDFVDLDEPVKPKIEAAMDRSVDNTRLGNLLESVDLIEDWCNAIRAQAESELLSGRDVPGYKLVQGKKGNRAWTNAQDVEALMKKMRLKQEVMYDFKLISPTSAEKAYKAENIGPRQWPQLQALITQAEGKPTVVPVSDKRAALVMSDPVDDFDDVTEATGVEDLI